MHMSSFIILSIIISVWRTCRAPAPSTWLGDSKDTV